MALIITLAYSSPYAESAKDLVFRRIEVERIERWDERSIRVNPDEVWHPAFWNELGDLISRISMRIKQIPPQPRRMCSMNWLTSRVDLPMRDIPVMFICFELFMSAIGHWLESVRHMLRRRGVGEVPKCF
jgi:hypothetical protein